MTPLCVVLVLVSSSHWPGGVAEPKVSASPEAGSECAFEVAWKVPSLVQVGLEPHNPLRRLTPVYSTPVGGGGGF